MSVRELKRVEVLARVQAGALKVKDAAVLMGVCERQGKRLWAVYQAKGPAGLQHQSVGKASKRTMPAKRRQQVLRGPRACRGAGPSSSSCTRPHTPAG